MKDGTVRELKLEPGAQIEVAEGDKVEILDSEGRPIEILADGNDGKTCSSRPPIMSIKTKR